MNCHGTSDSPSAAQIKDGGKKMPAGAAQIKYAEELREAGALRNKSGYILALETFLQGAEAELGELHRLLDSRTLKIDELTLQVQERDATLDSLRAPTYDIVSAMSSHLSETTPGVQEVENANRDILMEECVEAIEADAGDAELAAAEKWVAGGPKKRRTVEVESRCQGTTIGGGSSPLRRCSRSKLGDSSYCKSHSAAKETAKATAAADAQILREGKFWAAKLADEKAAAEAKTAELHKGLKRASKITKLAEMKTAKLAAKEASKVAKLAEAEAAKASKLAAKEASKATKLAEKEAAKATKLAAKEASKAAKLAEKETAKAAKPKRPTPPFALWQMDNPEAIARAVLVDRAAAAAAAAATEPATSYLTTAGRLWKALPTETKEHYKQMTRLQRDENAAIAALAALSEDWDL